MSAPPPYDGNPDRRSLPAGWITQYDPNYKAWFYVNTQANPPVTTWNHPSGPLSTPSPQPRYSSPPAPANYPSGYNLDGGQGGYPCQNSSYQQPPFGGYDDSRGAGYEQDPQRNDNKGLGGLLGRLTGGRTGHTGGGRPPFGSGRPSYGGGGYAGGGGSYQQQPQVVYQQPPRKSGIGLGGLALGAGAGVLGGVLLEEAFDNDFGGGNDFNDFGGGDFGGGDFGGGGGFF